MAAVLWLVYAGYFFALAEIVISVWRYRTKQARMDRGLRIWMVNNG